MYATAHKTINVQGYDNLRMTSLLLKENQVVGELTWLHAHLVTGARTLSDAQQTPCQPNVECLQSCRIFDHARKGPLWVPV